MLSPRETARIYDRAAECGPVAADEFPSRSARPRPLRVRSASCTWGVAIVLSDDERDAVTVSEVADGLEIDDVERGVANGTRRRLPWVLPSISGPMHAGRSSSAKRNLDTLPRQHVSEERVGGAVELWCGDDVVVHAGEVQDRVVDSCGAPELKTTAPAPPSNAARRRSSTSFVGLLSRL